MPFRRHFPTDDFDNLGAVIYRPGDDADAELAAFAARLQRAGHRVGGVVQRNRRGQAGTTELMEVVDLMTGRAISICQDLGPGSTVCKLDQAGLAVAAQSVRAAIAADVDLVIVNKFGKTEAEGRGLRAEILAALEAGLPLLTSVSRRLAPAWAQFTGGFGTTLICDGDILDDWWRDTARRSGHRRLQAVKSGLVQATGAAASAASLPDHHIG